MLTLREAGRSGQGGSWDSVSVRDSIGRRQVECDCATRLGWAVQEKISCQCLQSTRPARGAPVAECSFSAFWKSWKRRRLVRVSTMSARRASRRRVEEALSDVIALEACECGRADRTAPGDYAKAHTRRRVADLPQWFVCMWQVTEDVIHTCHCMPSFGLMNQIEKRPNRGCVVHSLT